MLHIICALKPEADPLLDHFDLRRAPDATRVYHNPDARLSLTLSGIGKSASAAAVARARDYFHADKTHAWLNLGVAGHISLPLGQAVIVNRITDAASGQTWFPSCVFPVTLPARELITLERPDSDYRQALFDMECAGFFQAASGCATLELVQAVKIVSDNAQQPMAGVDSALIRRLMTQNLPALAAIVEQLLALSTQQRRLNNPGPEYHSIIEHRHFTVTQQHQLQALLRKWRALHPQDAGLLKRLSGKQTAAAVLRFLQDELDRTFTGVRGEGLVRGEGSEMKHEGRGVRGSDKLLASPLPPFRQIYIEEALLEHPRARAIMQRFPHATVTVCARYGEIFNRRAQNFRLQKIQPALILAQKFGQRVLPSPPEYAIGGELNYYFSHMLNCVYDCRYCFLQGMHQSAHYVIFVNYEDFIQAIIEKIPAGGDAQAHFFSGYDCDSLALDPVTDFVREFLPVFRNHPQALLELRTKSTQIRSLLNQEPLSNCVIAFSFTPAEIAAALEHKTPSVDKRLQALQRLQARGWRIGLRFDPLIYQENARQQYENLFAQVFKVVDPARLHSVSLGSFRLPKSFYQTLTRLYPEEPLFASPLAETEAGMVTYRDRIRTELLSFCRQRLLQYVPQDKFFPCESVLANLS